LALSGIKHQFDLTFKGSRWILHVLYWCLLSFLFAYQVKSAQAINSYPFQYVIISSIIRFSILILTSYTFLFIVIPLYKSSRLLIFWMSMLVMMAGYFTLEIALLKLGTIPYPTISALHDMEIWELAKRHNLNYWAFFGFFIAFYYFLNIYDRQREIQMLAKFKTEKIALESSFLKSQVNPHFLFNTLNNIYALSLKKSEQTPIIIERLESLLHYMLHECKADMVPLTDEFTFTNSYIALEKLRHREEQCVVQVDITGDTENLYIAPLLLINFLENAFKHGTKTSFGKSWINMLVQVTPEFMHFNLQNSKPLLIAGRQNVISEYKGGIGLKNVKRRLQILYPGKHDLTITERKDRFEVDLIVNFEI